LDECLSRISLQFFIMALGGLHVVL
jgi:hypothetical protein